MSRIRSSNTAPEVALRKALFLRGYRYRLHSKQLPGRPDLVFPKWKKVILVHGCFWHLHSKSSCKIARLPKSRKQYWLNKLTGNARRDLKNRRKLRKLGWKTLVIWECEIRNLQSAIERAERFLKS